MTYKIEIPKDGKKISFKNGKLAVPDTPIIGIIKGDGIGPDITSAGKMVIDAAVKKAGGGKKKIAWMELLAGDQGAAKAGDLLPKETFDAIKEYLVAIKGPLTTPVGEGHRSLNVTLRQELDLYACVRPVKYFTGVPNPMKKPEELDVVIFRENTEDVYAGIDYEMGSAQAKKIIEAVKSFGKNIKEDSGIGIKPISEHASKRLVRAAINYAIAYGKKTVTLVHKGNIMKYTEGAFLKWGYEAAKQEFKDKTITEQEATQPDGTIKIPDGKILVNDRIADSMFQQLLLRPSEYSVIATTNLNGDYISDACAAQVGGLGIAPGANINYTTGHALFEATHGTAPKYADLDKANPGSFILSGAMMLEYLGWTKAADLTIQGLEKAIKGKKVTYDFARQMDGATEISCSEFAKKIIEEINKM